MQVEMPIGSNITDEEMHMIREMGVHWLAVNFLPEDATDEGVTKLQERAARYDLEISNGGAIGVYKNTSIILGREDREAAMDRYNEFTRILGAHGIKGGYIAWQPNGILRTKVDVGKYTRGGITMIADMEEIDARPILNDREYGEQEIWDNFEWFLERALPVCEEADVKISLHPNDPPAPSLGGAYSLIWRSDDYRRAFKMASDSPYLGMKLCTGCWLEGGETFGNLMDDIAEFAPQGKIHVVHFMLVGLLGLSTALENSGAAQLIADFIVSIIGADTHPFIVLAIFYFVANIVSQAFSNTGTMALLIPIMTTTCLTMGIDPVPVAMAVAYGANADSLLPMGSPGMAICFGSGGFKFTDLLLPGIVLMLIYGFFTVAMTYLTYFIL